MSAYGKVWDLRRYGRQVYDESPVHTFLFSVWCEKSCHGRCLCVGHRGDHQANCRDWSAVKGSSVFFQIYRVVENLKIHHAVSKSGKSLKSA